MAARHDNKRTAEQIERIIDCAKRATPRTGYTVKEAAKEAGCTLDTMVMVRTILEHGTAREIKAMRVGEASIGTLGKAIRRGVPENGRLEGLKAAEVAQSERTSQDAALYQTLREALLSLTGLPLARDVASITLRKKNRGNDVERCLPLAIQWLKEFEREFTKRSKAA